MQHSIVFGQVASKSTSGPVPVSAEAAGSSLPGYRDTKTAGGGVQNHSFQFGEWNEHFAGSGGSGGFEPNGRPQPVLFASEASYTHEGTSLRRSSCNKNCLIQGRREQLAENKPVNNCGH